MRHRSIASSTALSVGVRGYCRAYAGRYSRTMSASSRRARAPRADLWASAQVGGAVITGRGYAARRGGGVFGDSTGRVATGAAVARRATAPTSRSPAVSRAGCSRSAGLWVRRIITGLTWA